jgi:hypothetical protein
MILYRDSERRVRGGDRTPRIVLLGVSCNDYWGHHSLSQDLSHYCPKKQGLGVLRTEAKANRINQIRTAEASPEKAGVGGSIPSLATIFCNRLAGQPEISHL